MLLSFTSCWIQWCRPLLDNPWPLICLIGLLVWLYLCAVAIGPPAARMACTPTISRQEVEPPDYYSFPCFFPPACGSDLDLRQSVFIGRRQHSVSWVLFVPRPLHVYFLKHGGKEATRLFFSQLIGSHFSPPASSSTPHYDRVNGFSEGGSLLVLLGLRTN